MTKIGRNDRCPCNSNKKYKVCCLPRLEAAKKMESAKFTDGHGCRTETASAAFEYLQEEFPNFKIIDISDYLDADNYKNFQTVNYYSNILILAERNKKNDQIFADRVPRGREDTADMMVMHHGAYRCFEFDNIELAVTDIEQMIKIANKDNSAAKTAEPVVNIN